MEVSRIIPLRRSRRLAGLKPEFSLYENPKAQQQDEEMSWTTKCMIVLTTFSAIVIVNAFFMGSD